MWMLSSAMVSNREVIERFLQEGYEPFAVTLDVRGERVWFKKEVEELKSEVHSKSEQHKQRRSRKTAPKSKK